ncbi:ABC transporter permease [Nocardioides sp. dk4132]|uniref:branched-chain amino acid ABC transporter permease n=1 Tax=unclassified Nocardioides TaxID=2615069 RepID=UPI0012962309|nr:MULTISPECIES: ABC transporter permease [unclassified Nocardioides]MQW77559.1 ABC transporter permease [Nocardioides sp. dk4132]QGA06092.1 ABC transporter permease [Nocardioides sp. dk884]
MELFLTYTIVGLVLGSVYAIAASGLVLTYTTSGVFNFAHGAQAMLAAFLYWQLSVGWGLPVPVAFVLVVLVFGPLLGVVLHRFLMHGLRDVAEVTKVIVTVAVLLGMVSLSQWIWDPTEPRKLEMLFGNASSIELLGVRIRYHEIICLLAAALLALGLRLLFTRSRLGVMMRGVVDDPELLRLNGHNPDRVAMASWALGSGLAAFAGVLVTPVAGGSLEASMLTLLIIDTFAAAMFGRLQSIPRTFVGALVLGLASTYLLAYAPSSWDWAGNLKTALPMLVLFLVLLVLPQDRLRGAQVRTRERNRVPSVRQALVWGVVFVALVALLTRIADPLMHGSFVAGLAFAIIALSLVPLTGYAGEINLVPLSFGAVGVIVAFHVGIEGSGLASRMGWVGLLAGTVAAALVGGLVALPALRLRGLYLALATMAFGGLVSTLVLTEIHPRNWFGWEGAIFPTGTIMVPPVQLGPFDLDSDATAMIVLAAIFSLLGVGIVALRNTGYGRRLVAMKDSPAASAMLGQSLVRLKLGVFMLSAAIAGLGGILMASSAGSVSTEAFMITASLALVMLTVVGGVGYVSGALFGGMMVGMGFTLINGTFRDLALTHDAWSPVLGSMGHVFAVLVALMGVTVNQNPSGIVHQLCEGYRPLLRARPVLYVAAGVTALLVVLNLLDVIGDWTLALAMFCVVGLTPVLGQVWMAERVLSPEELDALAARRRILPVERRGLDAPLSREERYDLDVALGLPPAPLPSHDVEVALADGVPLKEAVRG